MGSKVAVGKVNFMTNDSVNICRCTCPKNTNSRCSVRYVVSCLCPKNTNSRCSVRYVVSCLFNDIR